LQDAGNAQRGYLLTNDPSFLRAFNRAVEETNKTVGEIDSLTIGNLKQQQNVKTLKNLINDRYRLLSLLLVMKYSVSPGAVVSTSHFEDKDKMDSIRTQIASMVQVEDSLLKEREETKESLSSTTPLYSLILSFASLLVIFIGVYKIRNAALVLNSNTKKKFLICFSAFTVNQSIMVQALG
jgi:CHASE3 domain sensor protein